MSASLEQYWVSFRDSNLCRQFVKHGWGSTVFRSRAYRTLDTSRRYWLTRRATQRNPMLFRDLQTFCVLIGHVKSGGTLIGSLLDAHPNIIFADEVDVLRYVSAGFSREQIGHILLKASRREFIKGRVTARRLTPYSFLVPNQWQGRYRKLLVMGDSRAGPTTRRLAADPHLIDQLHHVMNGLQVKLIHVVRNPFDPIAAMIVRGKRTFEDATTQYFDYCRTLRRIRQQLAGNNLLTIRYEDIIQQPKTNLQRLCQLLNVEASEDYTQACCDVLHRWPEQIRHMVSWDKQWIREIERQITQFDFLDGYAFAD